MRWLVCPDSFKDCLPAAAVAEALAGGLRAGDPNAEVRCLPLAAHQALLTAFSAYH